ncbi:MAG TPA: hypothetical protein VMU41_05645 [Candidatus Binataceae bacterium]|nr:hypothetical protein [Candidatus Binataceae bacterium]
MSFFKPALVAVTTIGFFSVAVSAQSQSRATTTAHDSMIYDAVVLPTPDQVQAELNTVGDRLRSDERASFYSPTAESDYLDAERDFKVGQYDHAADAAEAAAAALPDVPNWKTGASTTQEN